MPRHSLTRTSIDGANKGMDNKMSRTTKANKDRLPDKRRRKAAIKEISDEIAEVDGEYTRVYFSS